MWSKAKIAGLFIIFGLSFISSILPCITVRCLVYKLGLSSKFQKAIGVLNCFAGGVFFATFALDLLPEARESMEDALTDLEIETEFPLTECIVGMGFLFILFIEHCAHTCCSVKDSSDSKSDSKVVDQKDSKDTITQVEYHKRSKTDSTTDGVIIKHGREESANIDNNVRLIKYGALDSEQVYYKDPNHSPVGKNEIDQNHLTIKHGDSTSTSLTDESAVLPNNHENLQTEGAMQYIEDKSNEDHKQKVLRGMILLIALSLHMVFEGMALGLLDTGTEIWQLTLALSIHKVLVFFTIGLQVLELLKSVGKTVIVVFFISLVSPLGILIGELVTSGGDDVTRVMVTAILQSLAAGTFIFVTFFEILQPEFNTDSHEILKVFSTTLGFALIVVFTLLIHED